MKKTGHKRLTVDINDELFSKIKIYAAVHGISMKSLVTAWMIEKVKIYDNLIDLKKVKF